VSWGTINLAPLLYIIKVMEWPLLFLIWRLLLAIPTISAVSTTFVISSVSCVDFPIVLFLLRGPLVAGLKKLSPGLRSLNAYINDCK
jgi:hypothetical protein